MGKVIRCRYWWLAKTW